MRVEVRHVTVVPPKGRGASGRVSTYKPRPSCRGRAGRSSLARNGVNHLAVTQPRSRSWFTAVNRARKEGALRRRLLGHSDGWRERVSARTLRASISLVSVSQ